MRDFQVQDFSVKIYRASGVKGGSDGRKGKEDSGFV